MTATTKRVLSQPTLQLQTKDRFLPVLIMYHPSMQALAEKLVLRVQSLSLQVSTFPPGLCVTLPYICRETMGARRLKVATETWSCGRELGGNISGMVGLTSSSIMWRPLQEETVSADTRTDRDMQHIILTSVCSDIFGQLP